MAGAKVPLTFRIHKDGQLIREETLDQPVIKVGKLSSSHLRLEDESVSRMHAVIEVSGPTDISIIDLGSTKGTVVNGQKVNKARLQDGDEIVLGDLHIELSIGSGPAVAVGGDDDVTRVDQKAAPAAPLPQTPAAPAPAAAPPAPPAAFEPPEPAPAPRPAPPKPAAPTISAPPPAPAAPPVASAPRTPAPAPAAPPAAFGGPAAAVSAPISSSPPVGFGAADDLGGAGAVEVAAMLGDSVVGVKHVMNPRGGKVTGATYGLFAAGAILLVFSAFAFAVGVRNSGRNQQALDDHLEARKPIGEFRPHRISVAYDFLAFGGAAGGILCVILGLVRYREEKVQPYFRIGQSSDVDFPTDEAPAASFALVAPMGDDFVFNYGGNMTGEMTLNGQSQDLANLGGTPSTTQPGAMEVRIPPNARIRVTSGNQTFLVSAVSPPRRQAVPLFASVESTFLAYLGGSAILFLGVVALLNRIPPDSRQMHNEMIGADARLAKVQTDSQEDPKLEEQEEDDGDENDSGGTGTKMALDEGKMGKKESTRQSGQYAMEKTADTPQLAKEKQLEQAAKAGILGVLKQSPGGAFASLTGTADFSSGLDDRNVYGGLIGNEVGEMQGGWGYGLRGVGPGGGGTGWGTIGTGRYGLIGHGSGTGEGYGTGSGRGGMRGRKATTPQVRIGQASASGDLDKNIIRRYIRRQIRRIQNCYERELLVKPNISGTVVTQFQISPQGKVQGASANGVDGKVSGCVAGVIRSIKFPEPKGGGYVNVRYPFIFRAAGT